MNPTRRSTERSDFYDTYLFFFMPFLLHDIIVSQLKCEIFFNEGFVHFRSYLVTLKSITLKCIIRIIVLRLLNKIIKTPRGTQINIVQYVYHT